MIAFRGDSGGGKFNGYGMALKKIAAGTYWLTFLKFGVAAVPSTLCEVKVGDLINLTISWDSTSSDVKFYKNGQLIQTINSAGAIVASGFNFNLNEPGPIIPIWNMKCNIYSVNLYNRVLTSDEILYNFMHPGNPIRRGIQLNLTQDSIRGAQWLDLSGNNNHGTYVGGAVPQVANLLAGR
jgi:hypothetical protein